MNKFLAMVLSMIVLSNPPYYPFISGSFRVSSPFGVRNGVMHNGIDLVDNTSIIAKNHNVIIAVESGTVTQARQVIEKTNRTWEWGKYVSVEQPDGYTAYYCHLSKYLVKRGDKVKAGDVIGIAGSTGYSTGIHLHFELREYTLDGKYRIIDPADYLGIENKSGTFVTWSMSETYADIVVKICGLEEQTRNYINKYKYADDLWRKIAEHLKDD